MTENELTIRLTDEQQKQIQAATGKNVTALNIDLMAAGQVSRTDLDSISGGSSILSGKGSTDREDAVTWIRFLVG